MTILPPSVLPEHLRVILEIMLQIRLKPPVAYIVIQREVPASAVVSLHVLQRTFLLGEEHFPEILDSLRHILLQTHAAVCILPHLLASELRSSLQTELKLHRQFLPVTQSEHQRLAVIQHPRRIQLSRSHEILLPSAVGKKAVA